MITTYLTFAGFILAFLALINPIITFRLKVRRLDNKLFFLVITILGVIACLEILIPLTNITVWLGSSAHKIKILIFFCWNICLFGIILYLLYSLFFQVKFKKKNAKIYLHECSLIIESGKETDICLLAAEICTQVPVIFKYAHKDNDKHAQKLLELFSDEFFCKIVVRHSTRILASIFQPVIDNAKFSSQCNHILIKRLIRFLLIDTNSLLHREEPYHGLGRCAKLKTNIFGNIDFLISEYRPLSSWFDFGTAENLDTKVIQKYLEIIKFSLESCLETKENYSDIFSAALDNIHEIVKCNTVKLEVMPNSSIYRSNLSMCSLGLTSLVDLISHHPAPSPTSPIDKECNYSYDAIYDVISNGIFNAIEAFSINQLGYEYVRTLIFKVYYDAKENEKTQIAEIQNKLDILLKKKIEDNLEHLFYPSVVGSLINCFGLCQPAKKFLPIHNFLLEMLKKKFVSAYNRFPEIALDMLPSDTIYKENEKRLIRRPHIIWTRFKKQEELILVT